MSRTSFQHTSPSQSHVHTLLRTEAARAGFDVEILRDLLWLVNAHDQLIAFPLFCKNLAEILTISTKEWGIATSDYCLHPGTLDLLEWLVTHAPHLASSLGSEFARIPKHSSDNPVMGRGVTRHPTYAALFNSHSSAPLKTKYRLLQGHLLYAQAKELHARNNRQNYEDYGGQTPWKGLPNSPALGCLAVRELSEAQFTDILKALPVEQEPAAFAQSLNILPRVDNSDFLDHLKGLASFLQKAVGSRNWITRRHAGGTGSGGSQHIHGHIEISKQIYQVEIDQNDTNDVDGNWGDIDQVISIQPSPEMQKDLLSSDLCPDEFAEHEIFLTGNDSQSNFAGEVAANSAAQMRHVLMSNQFLPWNYQQLTITEVSAALTHCVNWFNHTFNKEPGVHHKQEDIYKLEAFCLMRTMLFTGSNMDRARELLYLPQEQAGENSALALIKLAENKYEWRIRAIRPEYRTNQVAPDGSDRKRTDYFTLPDIGFTSTPVRMLLDQFSRQDGKSESSWRVFRSRESTLRTNLKNLLTELDPSGRLTESKLSKFLFFRLLDESRGDVCAASLITGDEHRLAHVRLFYSMIPEQRLQQIYANAMWKTVAHLFSAVASKNEISYPALASTNNRFVGSRLCPSLEAVQNAIARIRDELQVLLLIEY